MPSKTWARKTRHGQLSGLAALQAQLPDLLALPLLRCHPSLRMELQVL